MILSGQTIRKLAPLSPFRERSVDKRCGMSWGLSCAGYDVRIKQKLVLRPGEFSLASTVEHFRMPANVLASVADKSSLARRGLAVQNTIIEPGWRGFLTIELTNHGREVIELLRGQPIAQIIFFFTDEEVERSYSGKYQDQASKPVGALRE